MEFLLLFQILFHVCKKNPIGLSNNWEIKRVGMAAIYRGIYLLKVLMILALQAPQAIVVVLFLAAVFEKKYPAQQKSCKKIKF
jgi:ABC-type multidrug transport system permease subunit